MVHIRIIQYLQATLNCFRVKLNKKPLEHTWQTWFEMSKDMSSCHTKMNAHICFSMQNLSLYMQTVFEYLRPAAVHYNVDLFSCKCILV